MGWRSRVRWLAAPALSPPVHSAVDIVAPALARASCPALLSAGVEDLRAADGGLARPHLVAVDLLACQVVGGVEDAVAVHIEGDIVGLAPGVGIDGVDRAGQACGAEIGRASCRERV